MRSRRNAIGTTVTVLLAIAVIVSGTVGFVLLTSQSHAPPSPEIEVSGPISTYPASWTDVCGPPVNGNTTTNNAIASSFNPGVANFSLPQVYSNIVSSGGFLNVSEGQGWVTTFWGLQQDSGPSGSTAYVIAQFVLIDADQPDGYVQAYFDLDTGAVTVNYEQGLASSCPAEASSSSGATLTEPSPAYYPLGASVGLTFYVTDDTVPNMSVSSSSCLGSFTILRGIGTDGPVVYNSTEHGGCSGEPIKVQLSPGQSYNQTVAWNQIDYAGAQVQPGTYEVMGIVAGSAQNFSSPVGEVYVGTPSQAVNSSILQTQFDYEGYVDNGYVQSGQPVKIVWALSNEGQPVYDLKTSACSYGYEILNLTNGLIFNSAKQSSCNSEWQNNPAPPQGGLGHVSYWNQTTDSGAAVGPGFYRALVNLHVVSGGHEYNLTANSDFEISASGGGASSSMADQIGVASSSICAANCGEASPYLNSSVYANGVLQSLQMYLNGTLVGTMNYTLPCCQLTNQVSFNTTIDSSKITIVPGVSYDIVFVGTFQDGNTSICWANPVNRANE